MVCLCENPAHRFLSFFNQSRTMKTELAIIVNDESLLKAITFNYEELKSALSERLEKYHALVVSEDSIAAAKSDRVLLNKLEAALKLKQQEIQMRLLGDFLGKIKELRGMVLDASDSIDKQVKAFEDREKDAKKAVIEQIYAENIGDLKTLVPFDRLFRKEWLNKTKNIKVAEKELLTEISTISESLITIDNLDVADNIVVAVKDYYLRTLNFHVALSEKVRLEKSAAELEQRRKAEDERKRIAAAELERRRLEEAESKRSEESLLDNEPDDEPTQEIETELESKLEQEIECIDIRLWVTHLQKQKLKEFLIENNIRIEKVPT